MDITKKKQSGWRKSGSYRVDWQAELESCQPAQSISQGYTIYTDLASFAVEHVVSCLTVIPTQMMKKKTMICMHDALRTITS